MNFNEASYPDNQYYENKGKPLTKYFTWREEKFPKIYVVKPNPTIYKNIIDLTQKSNQIYSGNTVWV